MTKKLDPEERRRRKQARDHAYYLKHYDANRQRLRAHSETWRKENPEKSRAINVRFRKKLREECLAAYGCKCACCGLDDHHFLCIDHVNGGGAKHRREQKIVGGGRHLYGWLKARGYPQDGFQVLCYNCNNAKKIYGVCPHQSNPSSSSC